MRAGRKVAIIDVLADGGMECSCATQREGDYEKIQFSFYGENARQVQISKTPSLPVFYINISLINTGPFYITLLTKLNIKTLLIVLKS
jgi:hypothetical protein